MRIAPIVLSVALFAPIAASAQASPEPKPDFSKWQALVGAANCKVTVAPVPAMQGKTFVMAVSADPAGYVYVSRTPGVTRYVGYDTKTSRWIATALYASGGSSVSTSPGWTGNTIVFTDAFNSDGSPLGTVSITMTGDRTYTIAAPATSAAANDAFGQTCTPV